MKALCAWCKQEWKQVLLGEEELYDQQMESHGVCGDHKKVMLKKN